MRIKFPQIYFSVKQYRVLDRQFVSTAIIFNILGNILPLTQYINFINLHKIVGF
jgi:hypothetical protein